VAWLQFTGEEWATPELQWYIRKSGEKADKLDAARKAIPKQTKIVKERVVDGSSGKGKTRLHFEQMDKAPPKLKGSVLSRPAQEIGPAIHGKIHEVEHEDVGVEAGHKSEELAEHEAGAASAGRIVITGSNLTGR
jgi:hypothetical protein